MPARTCPPIKKPIEKFIKAEEMPPSGPRMKIATVERRMWYAGEPIRGRYRLNPEFVVGVVSAVVEWSVMMQQCWANLMQSLDGCQKRTARARARHRRGAAGLFPRSQAQNNAWQRAVAGPRHQAKVLSTPVSAGHKLQP